MKLVNVVKALKQEPLSLPETFEVVLKDKTAYRVSPRMYRQNIAVLDVVIDKLLLCGYEVVQHRDESNMQEVWKFRRTMQEGGRG